MSELPKIGIVYIQWILQQACQISFMLSDAIAVSIALKGKADCMLLH